MDMLCGPSAEKRRAVFELSLGLIVCLMREPLLAVLTVDCEVKSRGHGADGVAELTMVGAAAGAVDRLYEHHPVVCGETHSVARLERPVVLHPHPGADGAEGLAGHVGGALVFYQDGRRAADGGSCYHS